MEITSNDILEVEVRDKRYVGLASANIEKVELQNALTIVKNVLDIVELATDASASIKKMIGELFYCSVTNLSTLNNVNRYFYWLPHSACHANF